MKLGLNVKLGLTQQLTPQQIQYLKLLQMPIVQLEQQVRQEIELNPMIADPYDDIDSDYDDYKEETGPSPENYDFDEYNDYEDYKSLPQEKLTPEFELELAKKDIDDKPDLFEFHKLLWDGGEVNNSKTKQSDDDDDDFEGFQQRDLGNFIDELFTQLRQYPLTEEELILGEQIIGNIDNDGYLRRDLSEIVEDTNDLITEVNLKQYQNVQVNGNGYHTNGNGYHSNGNGHSSNGNGYHTNGNAYNTNGNGYHANGTSNNNDNPAARYSVSNDSLKALNKILGKEEKELITPNTELQKELASNTPKIELNHTLKLVNLKMAESVLKYIQKLDPPGVGSRTIQECLLCQLKALDKPNAAQKLAIEVLTNCYDAFSKKHYSVITKQLEISEDFLKESIEEIKRLNPRPGGGDYQSEINTVTPDFLLEIDEETNELVITVNESTIPKLQVSKAYESLRKEAKYKLYNKDTKDWIRTKYDDAKFLIQALKQRKNTMTKVMTAIAEIQKDFFFIGQSGLKPLIYKDVSEVTGLDISTICRIVNGKYCQTDFGTFELKTFFSESLPNDDGEEVSTTVIKQVLKDVIDAEDKTKPLSDDDLSASLKLRGYNVARRTVAKYREQLKLPVARLRREIV